jgi:hypothetical protein
MFPDSKIICLIWCILSVFFYVGDSAGRVWYWFLFFVMDLEMRWAQVAVMMRFASRICWTRPWTVVIIQPELVFRQLDLTGLVFRLQRYLLRETIHKYFPSRPTLSLLVVLCSCLSGCPGCNRCMSTLIHLNWKFDVFQCYSFRLIFTENMGVVLWLF